MLGGLPAVALGMGGVVDVLRLPFAVQGLVEAGYPAGVAVPLGVVTLVAVGLYLLPRTAAVGAILLTGYLGGAVATHVRLGDGPDKYLVPVAFAVLLWTGLVLRRPRLRAVLPWR